MSSKKDAILQAANDAGFKAYHNGMRAYAAFDQCCMLIARTLHTRYSRIVGTRILSAAMREFEAGHYAAAESNHWSRY